jgi:hypothetical protein
LRDGPAAARKFSFLALDDTSKTHALLRHLARVILEEPDFTHPLLCKGWGIRTMCGTIPMQVQAAYR